MTHPIRKPVIDFDCYAVEPVDGDIQLGWKRLHDGPDIFWTPRNGGHWVLTRAADIYAAYRDDDLFSSHHVAIPAEERTMKFAPAEFDKPEHAKYRMAIAPLFTPSQIKRMEEKARTLSAELIDEFRPDGGCEFVGAFADRLPITIFLTMMDLPATDHALLAPHVEAIARSPDPQAIGTAFQTMIGYLDGKIAEREARGGGEDALSRLLASNIGERPATRDEVLSLAANVMFAGLDTVLSGMAFIMRFLAINPVHRRRLVDEPALIPDAIEELLRRHGIANLARMVSRTTEFGGVVMQEGDLVQLPTALHGLDERRFDDPLTVDFDRADKAHIAFAVGPHRCLGSHLARMELRVMLEEWLPRIPDFRVRDPDGVVARSGRLNALKSLPLAWN